MEEQNNLHEYRTGRTHPRKSHSGPVAALLIATIFFTGLVSALGLLNIHLFHQLEPQEENSISFAHQATQATDPTAHTSTLSLGMTFHDISLQYQSMYDLPDGLYISAVRVGSSAAKRGVRVGDVLTAFSGTPVGTPDALESLLQNHKTGDTVEITIYRKGRLHSFSVTVEPAE